MLKELGLGDGNNLGTADGRIALDCSVRETRQGNFIISTTDFFFPLVDSPYLQGRIGAANVLSDLFAEGVEECDFVLMLLAACRDMPEDQRTICTREMVKGFQDACIEAGTTVTGGQTVLNPWPIIGGVATSVVSKGEFIPSDGAKEGDVVVLTKPLGTQVAVNVNQWRRQDNKLWKECLEKKLITEEVASEMMHKAVCAMARLNQNGGRLMLKHGAHACTDVTGFGILGHAQNLSENQKDEVGIEIHTLPLLAGSREVNDTVFNFRLLHGFSAETSGGLMICIPEDKALAYCKELEEIDGCPSWIIGRVVKSRERKSKIVTDFKIVSV
jgi:selenide, water dikinase